MKKIGMLILVMGVLAIAPGCDDECGPFPRTYFNVVGIEANNVLKADTSWTISQYDFVEVDSNSWANVKYFGIKVDAKVDFYASSKVRNTGLGAAFACDPIPPGELGSQEIIDSLTVTSDSAFDSYHPAGAILNEFFMVSAVSPYLNSQNAILQTAIPLSDLLASQPIARRSLQLWLTQRPETNFTHRFTLTYRQTNGEEYVVTTAPVTFQ